MAARTTNKSSSITGVYQDELIALFDALVNVIFCVKGFDQRYRAVNTAFMLRAGKTSKRDVVGRRAVDLFPRELADGYEAQDARLFDTGEALRDELELIGQNDGSIRWYLTTKLPVVEDSSVTALVSISRDLQLPSDHTIAVESLTRVVEWVGDEYASVLRVADLAAVAGCSTGQLERRMKRVFGLTATQYVQRVRVDHAADLLRSSRHSLAAIATECGFYDQADFTRKFARLTNATPAAFRTAFGSQ